MCQNSEDSDNFFQGEVNSEGRANGKSINVDLVKRAIRVGFCENGV
jgi:hypothetical protein